MAFVSMCSGLFYAKLLRLLGKATVTFSSTLCVQYGEALHIGKTGKFRQSINDLRPKILDSPRGKSVEEEEFHAYPIIEFRIVNNRANHAPGKNEIWDAEVTAIVQLSIDNEPNDEDGVANEDEFRISPNLKHWNPQSVKDLGNDREKESQKVYHKLSLKPSFHPYFSRVWVLRHTLDATSPLLRSEVRNMLKDRTNGWDPTLNNHRDIRACLVEFNNLRIMMTGASALSRQEVYAEKVYQFEDICVGWRFIAVCYEDDSEEHSWRRCKRFRRKYQRRHFSYGDDTTTSVDLSLIHDIVPQRKGDFEPM